MSDDRYLWDRSGEPDAEIERLERTLAPLAHDRRPLALPAAAPVKVRRAPLRMEWLLAAAAGLVVVAGAAWWLGARERGPSWAVASVDGTPRIGWRAIGEDARLAVGQALVTDQRSRARIEVGAIGLVTLEPGSRLRLVRATEDDHRLALDRGTLRAVILAPPRQFTVETPAAAAVDLGCAYTLEVGADGRSVVTVESGWVSFEKDGREAFIPAGARSVTLKGRDPGTPFFTDADPRFVAALEQVDGARGAERDAALATLLAAARRDDALTLWHLLARLDGGARGTVYDRLAALVPPPAGVTRDGVLRGERAMLDAWWNELELGDVEWWRLWSQSPPAGRG